MRRFATSGGDVSPISHLCQLTARHEQTAWHAVNARVVHYWGKQSVFVLITSSDRVVVRIACA